MTAGTRDRPRRGDGAARAGRRRQRPLGGARGGRRGARARSRRRRARRSSSRSPTASSATPAATPGSTAPRASSTAGASATRWSSRGRGWSATASRPRSSTRSRRTWSPSSTRSRRRRSPRHSRTRRGGDRVRAHHELSGASLSGSSRETAADDGPFAGHAAGLTRRPLFDRERGTVHHSLVHCELGPGRAGRTPPARVRAGALRPRGTLAVDVAGTSEELGPDDYLWIELGVPHAIASSEPSGVAGGERAEPGRDVRRHGLRRRRGRDPGNAVPARALRRRRPARAERQRSSPAPGSNVGGASVRLLVEPATSAPASSS